MLFVTGLMLAGGLLKKSQIEEDAYAIITSSSVSVLSEPKNRSKELFVIHEGLKVKIMDQIEDWIEVKLSNGNEGWVKSEELIII
jgi:SH3-like domain-containing protein